MKITHQKEEVSRATICQYHNISILNVQDLIKGAVNDKFTIDGLLYHIDRQEKKRAVVDYEKSVKAGGFYIEILETHEANHPRGVCKKYVCNGKEYSLIELGKKLGPAYDSLQIKLLRVQKFRVGNDIYELVIKGYLYDMIHHDYDTIKKVTMTTVCEVAVITPGTARKYCKNGWYTKNGWRIKESE